MENELKVRKTMTVTIEENLLEQLNEVAKAVNCSRSYLVSIVLTSYDFEQLLTTAEEAL